MVRVSGPPRAPRRPAAPAPRRPAPAPLLGSAAGDGSGSAAAGSRRGGDGPWLRPRGGRAVLPDPAAPARPGQAASFLRAHLPLIASLPPGHKRTELQQPFSFPFPFSFIPFPSLPFPAPHPQWFHNRFAAVQVFSCQQCLVLKCSAGPLLSVRALFCFLKKEKSI